MYFLDQVSVSLKKGYVLGQKKSVFFFLQKGVFFTTDYIQLVNVLGRGAGLAMEPTHDSNVPPITFSLSMY